MALSGSYSNTIAGLGIYVEWSASRNVKANTSTITQTAYVYHAGALYSTVLSPSSSMGGRGKPYGQFSISTGSGGYNKIGSQSETFSHDANGNLSVSLSAQWTFNGYYNGTYIGTLSSSGTANIDRIDRSAANVSFNVTDITSSGFKINASASTNCNQWWYSLNGGSTWTQYSTSDTTSTSVVVTGLSAATPYNVQIKAKRTYNDVVGYSSKYNVKTLGGSVIESAENMVIDGSTVKLKMNNVVYVSSYTNNLQLIVNGTAKVTLNSISITTGDNEINLTSYKSTLLNAVTTAKEVDCTLSLTSFDGSTQIGNASTVVIKLQTTAAASAPTFSGTAPYFTYEDTNPVSLAITENDQYLIKGYSQLHIEANAATPKNNASIVGYSVTVGSLVYYSSGNRIFDAGIIKDAGTLDIVVSAYDSRGYTCSYTIQAESADNSIPRITSVTMARRNGYEDSTTIELKGSFSAVNVEDVNKNTITELKYRSKKTDDETYSDWYDVGEYTVSGSSFSFDSIEWISFDNKYSYNIQFKAKDRLAEANVYDVVINSGTPIVSVRKAQNGQRMLGIRNRNPQKTVDILGEFFSTDITFDTLFGAKYVDLVYPVGSIYESAVNKDPSEVFEEYGLFGGNWAPFGDGSTLVGAETLYSWKRLQNIEIQSQPVDAHIITSGASSHKLPAVFTVEATGKDIAYQWQYSDDDGDTWIDIDEELGGNTDTLTILQEYIIDGSVVRCELSDEYGDLVYTDEVGVFEYQEVAYIESTGSQYVDTGVSGNAKPSYDIKFNPTGDYPHASEQYIGGVQTPVFIKLYANTNDTPIIRAQVGSNTVTIHNNAYEIIDVNVSSAGRIDVTYTGGSGRETTQTYYLSSTYTTWGSLTYWVFGNHGEPNLNSSMMLYHLKMYDNNVLIRDFVPVYRMEGQNTIIGLLDLCRSKSQSTGTAFYANDGSGQFIKGGDITS